MVMWFLVWFTFTNNKLEHYQLGQFPTMNECAAKKEEAKVLIRTLTTAVYCFEVIPK
jgi:hypothetical protein|tara:strand:+ start:470 stop:640 length:171 start_codon:yes stop_codon:yes gene_type:complete